MTDPNPPVLYTFRFGTSNKLVHLTQQQIDSTPYLSTLVAHKDDFLSIRNENVLNPPIHYNWFMSIFDSITSEQSYTLFNELPEDDNILDTLQLFDYLGVNSFAFPLLEEKHVLLLTPINNENEKRNIEYQRASLSEARNTATEFVLALTKDEYDLHDYDTVARIFGLLIVIFYCPDVFSSRFRHHTLTIVKEYCWYYFSKRQQGELPNTKEISQNSKMNPWIYISGDNQPLPEYFNNAFAWNGVYKMTKKKSNTNHLFSGITFITFPIPAKSIWTDLFELFNKRDFKQHINRDSMSSVQLAKNEFNSYYLLNVTPTELWMVWNYNDEKLCIDQARSQRLNTLPKPPNVDKFKHRFGPKAQKYR